MARVIYDYTVFTSSRTLARVSPREYEFALELALPDRQLRRGAAFN